MKKLLVLWAAVAAALIFAMPAVADGQEKTEAEKQAEAERQEKSQKIKVADQLAEERREAEAKRKRGLEKAFKARDKNEDGELSLEEFSSYGARGKDKKKMTPEQMAKWESMFGKLDRDSSESLSRKEFVERGPTETARERTVRIAKEKAARQAAAKAAKMKAKEAAEGEAKAEEAAKPAEEGDGTQG